MSRYAASGVGRISIEVRAALVRLGPNRSDEQLVTELEEKLRDEIDIGKVTK